MQGFNNKNRLKNKNRYHYQYKSIRTVTKQEKAKVLGQAKQAQCIIQNDSQKQGKVNKQKQEYRQDPKLGKEVKSKNRKFQCHRPKELSV